MGDEHRFVIVIHNSEVSKKHMLYWVVKMGEKYKQYNDKLVCKSTGTRKCECLLKLKGMFVRILGWRLTIECGFHNHKVTETLLGHSYASCLSSDKKHGEAWSNFIDNLRSRSDKS